MVCGEDNNCRWMDKYNKCWYWMPDSKMTCDCINEQESCDEYQIDERK